MPSIFGRDRSRNSEAALDGAATGHTADDTLSIYDNPNHADDQRRDASDIALDDDFGGCDMDIV